MASETTAGAAEHAGRLRALVADDNQDAADSLARLLESWGHEVQVAYDGLSALRLARSYHPDVALLDLGLPGMDGYQVAVHIRQDAAVQGMMLLAVTGYEWEGAARRSHEYGFNDHFIKPVDLERLRALLATVRQANPSS